MGRNELICEQAAELIGAYIDDDLPSETRRRVERHLLHCASCAYESQSLRITKESLRGEAGDVIASDSFRTRTLRSLYADNPHLGAETEPRSTEIGQFTLPIGFH